jgi:hypothetical protein
MNTHKHTTLIRLASLALVALDFWLPSQFPLCAPVAMLVCWLLASFALAIAVSPSPSKFLR